MGQVWIKKRSTIIDPFMKLLVHNKLAFRLRFFFILVSLVPLLVLGIFSFVIYSGSLKDNAAAYTGDIISELNINLFLRFSKIDDVSKTLLNNDTLKSILIKNNEKSNIDFVNDSPIVNKMLRSIMFSNDYITSIYILPTKNHHIFATGLATDDYGTSIFTDNYRSNYKETDIYKETIKDYNNFKWWSPREIMNKRVFILSRRLYDMDKGDLGVMVIHIDEKIMDNMYDITNTKDDSTFFLTDEKGKIIYHPERDMIDRYIGDDAYSAISKNSKGSLVMKYGNEKYFEIYDTFFVTGWKFIVVIPYSKLMSEANRIGIITLVIAVVCLVLVIFISTFVTRTILSPIRKLMQLMKRGAAGNMEVRFVESSEDEIGQLGKSFNTMISSIQKLMMLVEDESNQKIEAQIGALEAQINPHFLYNTLASMYWSALSKGDREISQMALSLSNFFKLGLNKGKELTTVKKEVEHVKEYLEIQRMLYENRFNSNLTVDDNILKCRTIKLILQPLVENSLVHGLENKDESGFIKIDIKELSGRIVFRVADNGSGIEKLKEESLQTIINGGVGLKNVQDRLRLYFRNDFTIECSSNPDVETVFEISIPLINDGGEETDV